MTPSDRVARLLEACGTPTAILPPTALYNEGWMLRLVLDAYSRLERPSLPLKAATGAQWLSEVLLPSRFLARSRADRLAEGWTHADAVIGHVMLRPGGRGDITLGQNAKQFVVVEAKMFSPLSAGTRRAPSYNQAARNVACMAEVVRRTRVDVFSFDELAFVVVAPRSQLQLPQFTQILERAAIARVVGDRVATYGGFHDDWMHQCFDPFCDRLNVRFIAWEDALAEISSEEADYGAALGVFYENCVKYNQIVAGARSA